MSDGYMYKVWAEGPKRCTRPFGIFYGDDPARYRCVLVWDDEGHVTMEQWTKDGVACPQPDWATHMAVPLANFDD